MMKIEAVSEATQSLLERSTNLIPNSHNREKIEKDEALREARACQSATIPINKRNIPTRTVNPHHCKIFQTNEKPTIQREWFFNEDE